MPLKQKINNWNFHLIKNQINYKLKLLFIKY